MRKIFHLLAKQPGLSPGSLVHAGEKKAERVRIRVMEYTRDTLTEKELKTVQECYPFRRTPATTWINIDGLHQPEIVEALGKEFDVHPLVMEDILHTNQRPKIEEFDDYLFAVLRMFSYNSGNGDLHSDQFSLILRKDCLITFHERLGDVFEPVRERIRQGKGRIRQAGNDYLAYALLDAIVDNYFVVLERLSERIEQLEAEVLDKPSPSTLNEIHRVRSNITYLRKSMWPLREMVGKLTRLESKLITKGTSIFLRDLYDHTVQIAESIDTFREMVSGLLEVYLSGASNQMNEVMKVLTVFAAIFIPLTFLAGVYGMNFEYMPELHMRFAYPALLIVMVFIAILMLYYFKRKRWW